MADPVSSSDSNQGSGGSKQVSPHDAWANAVLAAIDGGTDHADGQDADQKSSSDQLKPADGVIKEIASARKVFEALVAHSQKIPDSDELKVFENISQKAKKHLVEAEACAKNGEFQKAKDRLENAELGLGGMQSAYEQGVSTASKLEGHFKTIKDLQKQSAAFYKKRSEIPYKKEVSDLLSYYTISETLAVDAKAFLATNHVKDASTVIEQMRTAVQNMELCFKEPKDARTAEKAKADDLEYGIVSESAHTGQDVDIIDDVFVEEVALAERADEIFALNRQLEEDHKQDRTGWNKKHLSQFEEAYKQSKIFLDAANKMVTDLWLDSDIKKALPKIDSSIESGKAARLRMKKVGLSALGHGDAESAEIIAADQDSQADIFEKRHARLKDDLDRLNTAVNEGNANWRPVCEHINGAEFDGVYLTAMGGIAEAEKWTQIGTEDAQGQSEKLQVCVSQVKANLVQLQKLFNTALELRDARLSRLEDETKASATKLQDLTQRRGEIEAWSIDLSPFDQARALAVKALERMNVTLADNNIIRAPGQLDLLNANTNSLQQVFNGVQSEIHKIEADIKFRFKNLKSTFTSLAGRKNELKKKPAELGKFEKESSEAFMLFTQHQAVMDACDRKAAHDFLEGIDRNLGNMKSLLGESTGSEAGSGQLDTSGRRAELLQAVRDRYSQQQQLEKWSNENDDVAGLLSEFTAAYEEAKTQSDHFNVGLIELARLNPALVEGAMRAIDQSLDGMDRIFQNARELMEKAKGTEAVQSELNRISDLMQRIKGYDPRVAQYEDNASLFQDADEKSFYKGLIGNLKKCLLDASYHYHKDDDAKGEEALENLDIYFGSLDDALKQAEATKKEVDEFDRIAEMASQSMATLTAKENTLKEEGQHEAFEKNRTAVKLLVADVDRHIADQDIKPIRKIIPELNAAVQRMETEFLKSGGETLKGAPHEKTKGSLEDDVAGQKHDVTPENGNDAEQKAKALKKEIFELESVAYKACEVMVVLDEKVKKLKDKKHRDTYINNKKNFRALVTELGEHIRGGRMDEARATIPRMKAAARKMEKEFPKTRGEQLKAAFGKKKKDPFATDTAPKKGKKK
ncbi:hypothetical protein [Pseudovibrio sp. Tun.PSC04-5.I4]|uniref:hypothetical protein n=1 Tax=Pseudovibrio sp. Tun.PSC04-5.I4 TaxID=1798213 RepID=UPI00088CD7D9|nr:hypothetical protein [Pseudovibrio sp. Tun.PSC04-5.I4]SDR48628.1 myosin protein heavy chain [Pseudovibrio sp. Tun.PSC04-5.I4]